MKNSKKYVVLKGIEHGNMFWTTNIENNTHSFEGELWYKEILFTDSEDEAIKESNPFKQ